MIRGRLVADQRQAGRARRLRRRARAAPRRPRVQPQPQRDAAGAQHRRRRPLDGRRDGRPERRGRPGRDARPEARRHAALRPRRHAGRGPHHQPAQGRLVVDAGQLLRPVPDRDDGRCAGQLHRRLSARPTSPGFDNALSRDFPNITSIDVSASIAQVQRVLDQVVRAVEFLFGFTLAAGLVVLFAAVSATREARAREFAVMRALGASGKLLAQVQRAELLGVGALAGVLASVAAIAVELGAGALRVRVQLEPVAAACRCSAALAGALLALAAGWWGLREVLTRPVVQTLAAGRRRLTGAAIRHVRAGRRRGAAAGCAFCHPERAKRSRVGLDPKILRRHTSPPCRQSSTDRVFRVLHLEDSELDHELLARPPGARRAERADAPGRFRSRVPRGARRALGRRRLRLQPARLLAAWSRSSC